MVNILSGSVSAYRQESANQRFIRIDEVMDLINVTRDEAMDIALAAGARYQLAKITLVHKERLMKYMKHFTRVPKGTEKILDLACGFGRHSLEFARRGYDVTGIDITPAYIDYANEQAKKENLNAKFICQDIHTITFDKEFDVVLNMADGAIGYLEDDEENHKIFSVIAKALKNGGKHFMDIMNGSYAQTHFPCKLWDAGEKGLTLSAFEWEKDRKTLIYGQVDYMYGEALYKPEMKEGNPIRLYSLDEITEIFCKLGLRICNSFADFSGKPSSDNDIQLMVYSIRE